MSGQTHRWHAGHFPLPENELSAMMNFPKQILSDGVEKFGSDFPLEQLLLCPRDHVALVQLLLKLLQTYTALVKAPANKHSFC